MRTLFILFGLLLFSLLAAAQAAPIALWTPQASRGLALLSGADGESEPTEMGRVRCVTTVSGSGYLYFRLDPAARAAVKGPVYLVVEYYDRALSGALACQYDSDAGNALEDRYRPNDDSAGGGTVGLRKWRTAAMLLQRPRFEGAQNLGADFRLTGIPLFLRSVRLQAERPADWDQLGRMTRADLAPLVKIGKGSEVIIGGWDPSSMKDAEAQAKAFEANAPALVRLGVTSHESYVRWNLCETAPGVYDWSVYDRYVRVYQRTGLKWVPFLIIGPPYALPDWYYNSPARQGYVCLEHNQQTDVESLFNPAMRGHVARFLKAFADHYRDSGVIESLLLGITGNYGEAIYVATPNQDWTNGTHGEYHTHPGYWAGDPYAVDSFRQAMRAKYASIDALNAAWKSAFKGFEEVRPFIPSQSGLSNRAKLDFTGWYIGSMSDWARFWMTETRAAFPKTGIYLCTGGHAPPEHGADFGEQCKIAASVGGGVRITNEASNYAQNFGLTRWVASAGRQYGAYFSFEPAGGVDVPGVVARVYNAAASGAKGLHYYAPNLFQGEAATANWVKYGPMFAQQKPVTEVAAWYPETDIQLHGQRFLDAAAKVRDRLDFAFLSDGQIADGGLKTVKALFLLQGTVAETDTWQRIADWVKGGGLLITAKGLGPLTTVEGEPSALAPLLAPAADTGKGRVLAFDGAPETPQYRAFLTDVLGKAPELSPAERALIARDGDDGIFRTLFQDGSVLEYDGKAATIRRLSR